MFFLIDGYNLVMAASLARTLNGPGNTDRARSSLLSWLSNRLTEIERGRTTVVFDAKPHSVEKKELVVNEIRVLFAVDHCDADSLLEEIIQKHSAPKQLVVVSSDRRIKAAAQRRRAQSVASQDWHAQIEHRSRQPAPSDALDDKPSLGNHEQLISEFDTAEIRRLIDEERNGEL